MSQTLASGCRSLPKENKMSAKTANRNYTDMTEGSIARAILLFAVPMMLGGLFQDLYSMVDMTIAGYTLGDSAIAAISATAAVVSAMNYASRGYIMGDAILISNAFGEGNLEKTRKTLIAMIEICAAYAVVFTLIFLLAIDPLMRFVNTPADLYESARSYAVIIILGLSFMIAYNVFACAFRALGNSKVPLYFLIFSSLLNIALDYLCIVVFKLGVAGAAYATIFSQLISAVLSGIFFFRMFPEMRFSLSDLSGTGAIVKDMFPVGISVAITNSIFAVGSVSIQGAINSLGSDTIIAHASAQKIRMFATIPSVNIANTVATFAAQNYGARRYDRITKGIWTGIGLSAVFNVFTYAVCFFFGGKIVRLITNTANENVVYMAQTMLNIEVLFIWAQTMTMSFRMSIQSLKRKVIPMVGTGVELVIRCVFAFVITPLIGFTAISYAEVASWVISGAAMLVCYYILINGIKAGKYRHI